MKSRAVPTALLILLVFTSFSFKCDGGPPPDNSPYRNAAKAADDIAGAINAMIKIKRTLAQQGTLKHDEEVVLTNLLLKVNTADKEFLKAVQLVKNTGDVDANKPKLCSLFAALQTALNELNTSGVSPLADATAKGKLASAFTTITSFLPAVTGVLACS